MTKYREIIRLTGLGFSQRDIMASIDAEHDISMREVYGLDKTLRE